MKYNLVLLDADRTLFDFDRGEEEAFKKMLKVFDIEYSSNNYLTYRKINNQLWSELEKGLIKKEVLQVKRFEQFASAMNYSTLSGAIMNEQYLDFLGNEAHLFTGALELLQKLFGKCKLVIASNGIEKTQRNRIEKSGIGSYLYQIVVSEAANAVKPNKAFFDYALKLSDHHNKEDVIILGDCLNADIKGGNDYNIATCWYNPENLPMPKKDNLQPTFTIHNLADFAEIVL